MKKKKYNERTTIEKHNDEKSVKKKVYYKYNENLDEEEQ